MTKAALFCVAKALWVRDNALRMWDKSTWCATQARRYETKALWACEESNMGGCTTKHMGTSQKYCTWVTKALWDKSTVEPWQKHCGCVTEVQMNQIDVPPTFTQNESLNIVLTSGFWHAVRSVISGLGRLTLFQAGQVTRCTMRSEYNHVLLTNDRNKNGNENFP